MTGRLTPTRAFILVGAILLTAFPIFWLFQMSLKSYLDSFLVPPIIWFQPTFEYYQELFSDNSFLGYLRNSFSAGILAVVFSMAIGVPAAYVLAEGKLRGTPALLMGILASRMVPGLVFLIPYFIIYAQLGILDTISGLVLTYVTLNMGLVVWSMHSYFRAVPIEFSEAARLDGATPGQIFRLIALPIAAPGLAATAILTFVMAWNEFLFALVLTRREAVTVPVAIAGFITYEGIEWGKVAAAAIILLLPATVLSFIVRRYFVAGLASGGIK